MRVLNLVTNPNANCYERQTRALERLGIECHTLGVPGDRSSSPDAIESRTLGHYVRYYPQVLRSSLDDYDLVHANYGLTGPFALAQPTRPVVLSLWGSDLYGRYGPVSRACARFVDETVVMSPAMADELGRSCHVIPHGVDTEQFRPTDSAAARAELGWDPDCYHVLFPYSPSRDVKDYPRARRIVALAREHVSEPIELQALGGVDPDRMPTYFNATDAMLLTSKHEGSPNSVKEALACNTPVVSTDVGDVRIRLNGVAHSHVARTDADLAAGLVDALEAGERSDGRSVAEELSLDRMGRHIRSVYRDALEL